MAQKGVMKFLSRKDGKNTVSDNKESEKVKLDIKQFELKI